ncbi:hypothetical protein GCK72_001387 [Caenorhabditis remanei]|uniref:Domain of unknown function WSN domain-containing protein n=1 Tax=Caenorhabditis remanei TaxID=31234 RepID=A0A6A5HMU5_CAERE|nr:hypothetical protein GCK72_001387 [Caenorhabditis remanei]KAF1769570.1 hypothetical protein GCK72_001387 [Caenorhabditis remanei]
MKTKTLLLLFLNIHLIKPQADLQCLRWFPEPVSYKLEVSNLKLGEDFFMIDDFLMNRDENSTSKVVEDYVIGKLNEGKSGGYSDIFSIVFKQLPSVRQLIISMFCLIVSVVIFFIVWMMDVSEFFEFIGIRFKFTEHRSGLTIIPIFCCIGLLVLHSNIRDSFAATTKGIVDLYNTNDGEFAPLEARIARKMEMVPCLFKKDFAKGLISHRLVDRYTDNMNMTSLFDRDLLKRNVVFDKKGMNNNCRKLLKITNESLMNWRTEMNFNILHSELGNLEAEYIDIILKALDVSIPIFIKALGTIEDFVEKYHSTVLILPKKHIIEFYETCAESSITISLVITVILTALLMVKFEFKIIQVFFRALIARITFIQLVHQQVEHENFAAFEKVNPFDLTENGAIYSINYGNVLKKAVEQETTLFHLLAAESEYNENRRFIPRSINGKLLFNSTKKFNATIEKLVEIMNTKYEKYVEISCEKSRLAFEKLEKEIEKSHCSENRSLGILNEMRTLLNTTHHTACNLKTNPIDKSKMRSSSYSAWVQSLLPLKNQALIRKTSVEDVRSPMQVYLIFENPSRKLRPTILENMLHMAVLIVSMAPIFLILAIYFMCILPLLMGDEESEWAESDSRSSMLEEYRSKHSSNEKSGLKNYDN